MAKFDLKSVVWKEGKYFVAQCLNVDISSFGKTKRQALANLDEALELYFEDERPRKFIKIDRVDVVPSTVEYA